MTNRKTGVQMKRVTLRVLVACCIEFWGTKLFSCHVIADPTRNEASLKTLQLRLCGRAETMMSHS